MPKRLDHPLFPRAPSHTLAAHLTINPALGRLCQPETKSQPVNAGPPSCKTDVLRPHTGSPGSSLRGCGKSAPLSGHRLGSLGSPCGWMNPCPLPPRKHGGHLPGLRGGQPAFVANSHTLSTPKKSLPQSRANVGQSGAFSPGRRGDGLRGTQPPPNHCHRGTHTLSSCILHPALSHRAGLQGPTALPRGPPSPFLPGTLNELGASVWHAGVHTTTRWASPPPRGVHSPPHATCPHRMPLPRGAYCSHENKPLPSAAHSPPHGGTPLPPAIELILYPIEYAPATRGPPPPFGARPARWSSSPPRGAHSSQVELIPATWGTPLLLGLIPHLVELGPAMWGSFPHPMEHAPTAPRTPSPHRRAHPPTMRGSFPPLGANSCPMWLIPHLMGHTPAPVEHPLPHRTYLQPLGAPSHHMKLTLPRGAHSPPQRACPCPLNPFPTSWGLTPCPGSLSPP